MSNYFKINVSTNGVNYSSGDGLQNVTTAEITQAMKKARIADIAANVLLIIGAFFLLGAVGEFHLNWLLIGLIGAAVGAVLKFLARFKLPVRLEYTLDTFAGEAHAQRLKAWNTFLSCSAVWEIVSVSAVSDQRNNSGAAVSFQRIPLKPSGKKPFYLSSNINPIICIKLKGERLIILPDAIISQRGGRFAAVDLSSVQIKAYNGQFIERGGVTPPDAEIVEQTWQYVNQDGSPDRRHSENAQLPVCLYGYVELSGSGLSVKLSCSNSAVIKEFTPDFQAAP